MSNDEIPFSKKDQRKLSAFLGNELLYDYLSRKLDTERMRAMDEVVAENREIQDEIQSLNSALNYVEHMAESDISESLLEQVRQPVSYFQGLLQKIQFHEWPRGFKLGLEAIFVVVMLTSVAMFFPWHYLAKWTWKPANEVVLSELKNEFKAPLQTEDAIAAKELPNNDTSEVKYQDEGEDKIVAKTQAPPAPVGKPAPAAPKAAVPPEKVIVTVQPEVQAASAAPHPSQKEASQSEDPSKLVETVAGKRQGWLYRGTVSVVNQKATAEKFVAKITEFGGRKAGEVELGWNKPEGNYFHFTIPESKYQELEKYLASYGQLKIQKEKHDRIMPDGIIRLILTVSESKKKSP